MRRRLSAAAALLGLLLCACSAAPAAPVESAAPAPVEESVPLPVFEPVQPAPYQELPVYFDGLLTDRGYVLNGEAFISPEQICRYYGLELEISCGDGALLISAPGLELSGAEGQEYMTANCRYLYTPNGYLCFGGRVYLPADVLCRVFGVDLSVSEELSRADLKTTGMRLIDGGEDYYQLHFSQDDLFWLSRIIYAEARYEPLAGMIGVGNVVFNRVESELFPYTVFDVIFDRQYDITQFDPVDTGGVLEYPDERAVIAACLCLEGYNTVGGSLFFVNPVTGDSRWFESALEPVISIGNHDFYI